MLRPLFEAEIVLGKITTSLNMTVGRFVEFLYLRWYLVDRDVLMVWRLFKADIVLGKTITFLNMSIHKFVELLCLI